VRFHTTSWAALQPSSSPHQLPRSLSREPAVLLLMRTCHWQSAPACTWCLAEPSSCRCTGCQPSQDVLDQASPVGLLTRVGTAVRCVFLPCVHFSLSSNAFRCIPHFHKVPFLTLRTVTVIAGNDEIWFGQASWELVFSQFLPPSLSPSSLVPPPVHRRRRSSSVAMSWVRKGSLPGLSPMLQLKACW
jgi:hypothetical protein